MEHLDFPDKAIWNERNDWFNDLIELKQGLGSYFVSEQARALFSELHAVYCCGAWHTVVVLSVSIIDAQLREYELPDHKGSTFDLAKQINFNPDFDWLRKKRNKLVHIDIENPAATTDDYFLKKPEMQDDAKRSIELVCEAPFLSPGT